jgi:hypothetical protein
MTKGALAIGMLDFVLLPLELAALMVVFQLCLYEEQVLLKRVLADESGRGLIPAEHLAHLCSYHKRMRPGWLPDDIDRRRYSQLATTLAFRVHQSAVATDPAVYLDDAERCRDEIRRLLDHSV